MRVGPRSIAAVIALSIAVSPFSAYSEEPKPENPRSQSKRPGSGPNPFRDCGIGAALFSNTGWAAVTSNVIWDLGLTGSTSATSSPETCNGKEAQVAQFIADTYVSVVDETARGSGEHLNAMLDLYECRPEAQAGIVGAIRSEVGAGVVDASYASMTSTEKAEQYYLVLSRHVHTSFAEACSST